MDGLAADAATSEGAGVGQSTRPPWWRLALLAALGGAALALYVVVERLGDLKVHPLAFTALFAALCGLYGAACWLVLRGGARLPLRPALAVILVGAVAYRAVFLPAVPSLSDDFFRYAWDGYIQHRGYSPYRYPPEAPALAALRDGYYWPQVNRKAETSAYPPFAELFFRGLAVLRPLDTAIFKLAYLALDLATMALLGLLLRARGQSPLALIVYAWHPLPVFEFFSSLHIDVLAVCLIVAALVLQARGREVAAGVALGLATLTKLYPGLLLPAFARRGRWRLPVACVATVLVGFAPSFLSGDTNFRQLPMYLHEEGYQSGGRFFPLVLLRHVHYVPTPVYVVAVGTALAGLALWLSLRPGAFDVPRRALPLAGAILALVTPTYPWYFIWLLPLLAVERVAGLWLLTGTIALSYTGWYWFTPRDISLDPVMAAVYLPVYALLLWRARGRLAALARRGRALLRGRRAPVVAIEGDG
ncbi:MAG TPA: glycosyltransferase family 87 protein [Thermomicrobiales bacterium]|nr:glycosyltransferase family 87 protein [Thermomicrobiales bacterium]